MAPASTAFNSVLLAAYVVVVALLSVPAATRVSAQGLAMAPSPAISLDTGAAPSLGVSGAAAILCSFLLATLHLFFGN
ncbi:hypothetical protein ACJRO7_031347 [Eucalyptus globulus]|uniref:Uncharacterized protein n=1 Tax=Eucalyptus globulus TaxID=34317 RepID=A0ABD3JSF1_EUCGL